jgi:Nitrate and nitrite sensing/HAMP domain/Histidine kinase-, DNA gyrase B-, and HSP90-like ATPase
MLQNLQIRSKLAALLLLPLVALTVFASTQVVTAVRNSADAGRVNAVSHFSEDLVHLADALQRERALTMGYGASQRTANYGTMISDRVLVNEQRQTFEAHLATIDLDHYSERFRKNLGAARGLLADLFDTQRTRFENDPVSLDAVTAAYDRIIEPLLASQTEILSGAGDSELFRNAAAFMAISRAKQAAANAEGILFAALTARRFDPARNGRQFSDLQAAFGAEQAWITQFRATASSAQLAYYAETVTGPDVDRVDQILSQALAGKDLRDLGAGIVLGGRRGIRPEDWLFPASARTDLLRTVELQLAGDVGALSTSLETSARRRVTASIVVVVVVLLLTIGFSLLVARSMVRPLQLLEQTALDVADRQLPGLVDRLQHAEQVDMEAEAEPLPLRSRDEIGRVAAAFNSVHRVAIRTATEQAALRRSIGDMFINLARRSQTLINRQLDLIDAMEREQRDPDELTKLYRIDHLATRMRRNAENLIVMATAEPAQRWSEATALSIVIGAAISEVEDYGRVELLRPADLNVVGLRTPGDVVLAGHAVSDLVHLLAELIENATTFSPPDTPVMVTTQPTSRGYLVQIEDRGRGMSEEELADANQRLANPPRIDFALSRKLGFFVVGRLAERHGIKVQLRRSFYDGVAAQVLIPPILLAPSHAHAGWPFEAAGDLAAEDLAAPPTAVPSPPLPAPKARSTRSPEEIRAMLSAYHEGLRHGRLAGTRAALPADPAQGSGRTRPPTGISG